METFSSIAIPKQKVNQLVSDFRKNSLFIFLVIVLFAGIAAGALMIRTNGRQISQVLSSATSAFLTDRSGQTMIIKFFHSFFSSFWLLALIYVFGFSPLGQIPSAAVVAFRGLGLGVAMGFEFVSNGYKGMVFVLLLIIPHAFISTFVLLKASKNAVRISNLFAKAVVLPSDNPLSLNLVKSYSLHFLVFTLFIALSSVVDLTCVGLFSRFFV